MNLDDLYRKWCLEDPGFAQACEEQRPFTLVIMECGLIHEDLKLSRKAAAAACGLSPRTYSRFLTLYEVRDSTAQAIVKLFAGQFRERGIIVPERWKPLPG